ncbi:MAG: hypothetical protein ACAH35_00980, partial [Candidatus Paceibacterota bacterium]
YVKSGPWVVQRYLHTVRVFDGTFAVVDTWRNMGRPLFQDYTWQGRIIGVFLRLARIMAGLFVFVLAALLYAFFYLLWLLFPVICVASIIGGLTVPLPL